MRGDPREHQSVRRHLGQLGTADRDRREVRRWYGMEVDHDREVTVTCGATEAMAAVFLALLDPGDEVIIFEPFYENYGPDAILAGAIPGVRSARAAALDDRSRPPEEGVHEAHEGARPQHSAQSHRPRDDPRRDDGDRRAVHQARRVGHHRRDLRAHPLRGRAPRAWRRGPACASAPITISGLSKTFSCTGWRLGYASRRPPRRRRSARCTTFSPSVRLLRSRPQGRSGCSSTPTTTTISRSTIASAAHAAVRRAAARRGSASRSPRAPTTCSPISPR